MDKPIKDWTLSEAQAYCSMYRSSLKEGFCEESDCELRKRGICCVDWVHNWNLSTYTESETDDAINILRLFPTAISIERHTNALTIRYNENYLANIDYDLFPSIQIGQTVMIEDILED